MQNEKECIQVNTYSDTRGTVWYAKVLHVWSLEAMFGRKIDQPITYLDAMGAGSKKK